MRWVGGWACFLVIACGEARPPPIGDYDGSTLFVALPPQTGSECPEELPDPNCVVLSYEDGTVRIAVKNRGKYPASMFQRTTKFGPCGSVSRPSRTIVEFLVAGLVFQDCEVTAAGLGSLELEVPANSSLRVSLVDRGCGRTYTSDPIKVSDD